VLLSAASTSPAACPITVMVASVHTPAPAAGKGGLAGMMCCNTAVRPPTNLMTSSISSPYARTSKSLLIRMFSLLYHSGSTPQMVIRSPTISRMFYSQVAKLARSTTMLLSYPSVASARIPLCALCAGCLSRARDIPNGKE
jgi:hypothetical protein